MLIAQLMLQPADVLLLDEPTNDLDIPTLEILEESLLEYPGALVLVTHDRYMLDRISNVVLGLDGARRRERFADYSQWEAWMAERELEETCATAGAGSDCDGEFGEKEVVVPGGPEVGRDRGSDRRGGGAAGGGADDGRGSGSCDRCVSAGRGSGRAGEGAGGGGLALCPVGGA